MPTPGFILKHVEAQYELMRKRHAEEATRRLLSRPTKPDDSDGWDSDATTRHKYARAYINAKQEIRDVMKTMSTERAIEYAVECGVDMATIQPGLAGAIVGAMRQRENAYVRE